MLFRDNIVRLGLIKRIKTLRFFNAHKLSLKKLNDNYSFIQSHENASYNSYEKAIRLY